MVCSIGHCWKIRIYYKLARFCITHWILLNLYALRAGSHMLGIFSLVLDSAFCLSKIFIFLWNDVYGFLYEINLPTWYMYWWDIYDNGIQYLSMLPFVPLFDYTPSCSYEQQMPLYQPPYHRLPWRSSRVFWCGRCRQCRGTRHAWGVGYIAVSCEYCDIFCRESSRSLLPLGMEAVHQTRCHRWR